MSGTVVSSAVAPVSREASRRIAALPLISIMAIGAAIATMVAGDLPVSGSNPAPGSSGMSLVLASDASELRIEGEIVEGTGRRLRHLLRANPAVKLVTLTSEGGLVDEAEQIGALVAAHGLSTYVPEYCISACTLAFVRGQERLVATGGRLGFHAPWERDASGREIEVGSEDEKRSYLAAGIAPDFAAEALRVPASEIWFPEPSRLLDARVATGFVEPADLSGRIGRLPAAALRWASAGER